MKLTLSPPSGPVSTSIDVSGSGFEPGESVTIYFFANQVGVSTAGDDCSFSGATVTIPAVYAKFPGTSFKVSADGQRSVRQASAQFMLTSGK
jgi:hypothetical protein